MKDRDRDRVRVRVSVRVHGVRVITLNFNPLITITFFTNFAKNNDSVSL